MIVSVNGVKLFYEGMGNGNPLILLHGNGLTHKIFNRIIEPLSKQFTVYAIDSRGHGKSSKVKDINYNDMADDVIEFITAFALKNVTLYGFSDGGIIGLLVASKAPELIEKLIVSGANTSPAGTQDGWLRLFRLIYFLTKDTKFKMMLEQPNISNDELERITADTLVLAGQHDMIKEEHTRNIAKHIQNSTLRILKGESHTSYVMYKKKLIPIITEFCQNPIFT
ncbi:MAG: alpha/beta hydrolase [Eubacteriales bacterium]